MGLAEDKVYDYILKNLKNFKNIRVASLADSLSCLTDADRDELHTREETRGSQATVYRFYQHLKCRQGWVPDLINALRQNNAGHLADELQHVYDSWQARSLAPTAASFSPAASDAHPAVSSISAQTMSLGPNPAPGAPLAEQPRRDLPVGGRPPLLPGAATTVSTDLDARAPVQESLPKNLLEQESARSPPPGSAVRDGVSDGHGREGHPLHPIEAVPVAGGTPGAASVAVPSAAPPEWGRDWLSRQQHPVCVDNGCFGNANHLHRSAPGLGLGRSLLLRDAGGSAHSPKQPRNEPEEDFYVSTESPLRLEETARSGGPQPPDSQPKQKAVPGSEHSEPPGSFVDVRSPLLIQQQFDVEQKRVVMLQEHGGDGGGFPSRQFRVAAVLMGSRVEGAAGCPSCLTVRMESGREGAGQPKVVSAFVAHERSWRCREQLSVLLSPISPPVSWAAVTSSRKGASSRGPPCSRREEQIGGAGLAGAVWFTCTYQESSASSRKSKTHLLGLLMNTIRFVFSLTDTWLEATGVATPEPRDASPSCDTSVKPPVQEKELPTEEAASSTPSMPTKEKVLLASMDPPPPVAGSFEGTAGRTASRVSSATSIWVPCNNVEGDVEFSKPGVLCSVAGESPEADSRCPSSRGPSGPSSGASDSLSFSSDPLMVSTDSSSSGEALSRVSLGCPAPAAREDPGGKEAAGASRDSRLPPSWDSTSLGTHEVRMDHYPSTQLGAGSDLRDRAGPFGNSPVFDSSGGQGTATSSSQAKVPPGDSNGPSLPYIVPAVGIALISAVAFLVYARLQK
ncbi:mitochondrial antiviral-signaling protein [Spheniscus humboldti]